MSPITCRSERVDSPAGDNLTLFDQIIQPSVEPPADAGQQAGMDLFFNAKPRLTEWLVGSGALREPFVVLDVGVQGGESPRWQALGDHLIFHGFDAIEEVVEELARKNSKARNKTFHWFAIGNEDGEREFYFKPGNPTNSSFYQAFYLATDPEVQVRKVPVRRLDTLLRDGVISRADFLKVDVEGFETEVFGGATALLEAGVLGVESETNFATSSAYPDSHFALVQTAFLRSGLVLFDLNFNRVPRASYHQARKVRGMPTLPPEGSGQPQIFNVLFCRDLAAERDGSLFYKRLPPRPTVDQILKTMVIYELYGLNDVAVDTAVKFSAELGQRIDVERGLDLLCQRIEVLQLDADSLRQQIHSIHASTSWRITAPLRAIANVLKR
jgi:FkbM family methyltransferase